MIVHTSGSNNPPVFTIEKFDSLTDEDQSISCQAESGPMHPNPQNPNPPTQ